MTKTTFIQHFLAFFLFVAGFQLKAQHPLPEHPRPDWKRSDWINLNGSWSFRFDSTDVGMAEEWHTAATAFPLTITVPFSWGAPLSGLADSADIGWYRREVTIPADWDGRRVFIVLGASDWQTTVWLDGQEIGRHRGGYTPFAFELSGALSAGQTHRITIRVDDTPHDFKLEGKQGYGPARGIWQTVYLEARGAQYLQSLHFSPDIAGEMATVKARLPEAAAAALPLRLRVRGEAGEPREVEKTIPAGASELTFELPMPDARLWQLNDPHLYQVDAQLGTGERADRVATYFGMREISVTDLPGTDYRYVALNGKPVYLQMALDQAYHPEGFYTFPTDEFIRDEVLMARQIGLNGIRVHVKIGHPRKLYWADRLGMLVMADVPNSWGEPGAEMQREIEHAMRGMMQRDYNHPSIFSWVIFNETWGLFTKTGEEGDERRYLPETKEWVVEMVELAKSLDPTRLVEDNSPCCGIGHTVTDLNTWHSYLPGWAWEERLSQMDAATYPTSSWNFEPGYEKDLQPNINSEFGNVWGYKGSTGDVDWSWDYHRAINAFRRHTRIAGWLYTQHHDVINEWNGYWRYDRSKKFAGMDALVEGMSVRDLHRPLYIATGNDLSREVKAGATVSVPLHASFFTDGQAYGGALTLRARLYGWDELGREASYHRMTRSIAMDPWMQSQLEPLEVEMPTHPAVAILELKLEDATGKVHHRNFTTFVVKGENAKPLIQEEGVKGRLLRTRADAFTAAEWSLKQWNVREGRKVNGAGHGYFEYRIPWPEDLQPEAVAAGTFLVEASAKQLFGKDRDDDAKVDGDYMRGGGALDPSRNPNAYPMTDEQTFPSAVHITVNGASAGRYELPDDPADHRGILSWHYQLKDRRLREAGSYGYLLRAHLSRAAITKAASTGELIIRLSVDDGLQGGLAIYGAEFGRYMVAPSVLLLTKE